MESYRVIGIMSGSSMDGVDLAYCEFTLEQSTWRFTIGYAETIPYSDVWLSRLNHLPEQLASIYAKTDAFYGKYLGQLVREFIKKNNLTVDFIASHGHTIFHQPHNGFTAQIGDGAAIHAETNLPVVCNFRTVDVALGGQGAPLVPKGDHDLFPGYDACLNLGGFANISFTGSDTIKAFDICPCNTILNHVAGWMKLPFDDEGRIAAGGKVNQTLCEELNALEFYEKYLAKSLGKEWVNDNFWPVVKKFDALNDADILATFAAHISDQVAKAIGLFSAKKVLVTGGGAFNKHLVDLIKAKSSAEVIVPEGLTVNYKEALIFAYLGVLRVRAVHNVKSSVTGSLRDHIGGALYGSVTSKVT